jgi:antitoxin component of RelBE/YafQ-DinJ toxin-antitoxin module
MTKETRLNIRISPELKTDFETWCDENGTDPSHEIRRYITMLTKNQRSVDNGNINLRS